MSRKTICCDFWRIVCARAVFSGCGTKKKELEERPWNFSAILFLHVMSMCSLSIFSVVPNFAFPFRICAAFLCFYCRRCHFFCVYFSPFLCTVSWLFSIPFLKIMHLASSCLYFSHIAEIFYYGFQGINLAE